MTIDELAKAQNVKPMPDVHALSGTWPGEKDDGFEKSIDEQRHPRAVGGDEMSNDIPWNELVPAISINPDCATRHDIARLAAELMEANHRAQRLRETIVAYLAKYDEKYGGHKEGWPKVQRDALRKAVADVQP